MQKGRKMNGGPIRREDEAAIRQLVQDMQEGQNTKNGELFASAFAKEHDYVAISGKFLPNQTQEDNARIHQGLYDESRSSVAGKYAEVEVRLHVAKIRPLTAPEMAVAHVESEFRLRGQGEKAKNIITAVMQKREGEWEIVAFHNAPIQKRNEEGTGFVIQVEGLETSQGGKAMIKDVPLLGIFVDDQEGALDFYTNKLGLQKV
jgi:uncharacterized protein (TIGR02246 family)